jgi:adenylyltransferase/sulfurtransferase
MTDVTGPSHNAAQRYARHLVLPHVGPAGQAKLRDARVLIVGVGGLGAPAALYLAAAGVGRLGLVDHDEVALHNLQRQVLFDTPSVGTPKTAAARTRLEALNPEVAIDTWQTALTRTNARGIVADYDVVLDCTDSFATRYLLNDACVLEGKPLVQASVHRFEGRLSVYATAEGPCYRCVHPTPPAPGTVADCATGGVLGVLPGILGALQATEAIKLVLGIGAPLVGRLLLVDALGAQMHEVALAKDPGCVWCGTRGQTELLADYEAFCGAPDVTARAITPDALATRLARGDRLVVLDVREGWEVEIAAVEGSVHLPMAEVPRRHTELPRDREIVVLCHHGMRSAMVADYLRSAGFPRVLNLTGGIDRWSVTVDRSVARY